MTMASRRLPQVFIFCVHPHDVLTSVHDVQKTQEFTMKLQRSSTTTENGSKQTN